MADGQEQRQISPTEQKAWGILWNFRNRIFRGRNIWRYSTLPGQAAPIWTMLPIDKNNALLGLLAKIEAAWKKMDIFLWEPPQSIIKLYEELGHYNDPVVIKLEKQYYLNGGKFGYDDAKRGFYLDPVEVAWNDGNREELYIFGIENLNRILDEWQNRSKVVERLLVSLGADADSRPLLSQIRDQIGKMMEDINSTEHDFYNDLLQKEELIDKTLPTLRRGFLSETSVYKDYVRFKHTYKVINPFLWDESSNRAVFFDPKKNKVLYGATIVNHQPSSGSMNVNGISYKVVDFKPWPWEQYTGWEDYIYRDLLGNPVKTFKFMTGLDENGYPLEIDENGMILLDKWWYEIGQNTWQMEIIESKTGGQEIIQKINHIKANGVRVVDKKFTTDQAYLDLLEMAVYIYGEVDAVRDDLRDGRFHPYSKTTTDYIVHAEGGLEIDPNKFTVPREILKQPIKLRFDEFDLTNDGGYIKANPDFFNNPQLVPKEELKVKRTYQIKEFDISAKVLKQGQVHERKPTQLNPAFDRRALNSHGSFIHWGRMYYYEDGSGINKWSENPYPHISTRGIAKYIMYWVATKTQNFAEAVEAANHADGYDIGIRRPLVGGRFVKNPYTDIISMPGR